MKTYVLFWVALAVFVPEGRASRVVASSLGYDPTDATAALHAALAADVDTVIIDVQSNPWRVGPGLFIGLHDKVVLFEPGVVVRALPGQFPPGNDCLFKFIRCRNLELIGYGAILRMNKAEYMALADSEYRHCIQLDNCRNIQVRGFTLRDSGGDGLYVGGADWYGGSLTYSENILVEDVQCINNYRQGMSITSVQNMVVRQSRFSQTEGTLPEAGIDVEPFEPYQRIVNLSIEHCVFEQNGWTGLALALFELDSTSLPVSIAVSDCVFRMNCRPGHPYGCSEITLNADDRKPVKGQVRFERCLIDSSDWSALYTRKTAAAYKAIFKDCVFNKVSGLQLPFNEPIFLEVPDYDHPSPALGGLFFDRVVIAYATNFAWMRVYGWPTLEGVDQIGGRVAVVAPGGSGAWLENVPDTLSFTVEARLFASAPAAFVEAEALQPVAEECSHTPAVLSLTRSGGWESFPLAVRYSESGTAQPGLDYHAGTGATVFGAGQNNVQEVLYARRDALPEGTETLRRDPLPSAFYGLGPSWPVLELEDCAAGAGRLSAESGCGDAQIYPNPAHDVLHLHNAGRWVQLRLVSLSTQASYAFAAQPKLDLRAVQPGTYLVLLERADGFVQRSLLVKR